MREPSEIICVEMPVPESVIFIKEALVKSGGKLYMVGGCVRDFWKKIELGTPYQPKDYDLVTDLLPDQVVESLKGFRIKEVGKSFGVVLVTVDNVDYEIATFREDSLTGDGRRPDSVVFSTIDKDAERRDLTINALYYDIDKKCIIDFFGGIKDIRSKTVRFVGDPYARIKEDKLRVMRFVRFHCRMVEGGPETVHKDTRSVIKSTHLKPVISDERIRDEFLKGISSALSLQNFLYIMEDLGLLKQTFTGLKVNSVISKESNPDFVVAQILRYNDSAKVKETLLQLKWTAQEAVNIAFLVKIPCFTEDCQFVEFKKGQYRTSLCKEVIKRCIDLMGVSLSATMLDAPYPTIKGDILSTETGLTGKSLGEEMTRREIENFKLFREQ